MFLICICFRSLTSFEEFSSLFWFIRVEYKQLHKLRDVLLDVPFVGLTATATEKYVPRIFV